MNRSSMRCLIGVGSVVMVGTMLPVTFGWDTAAAAELCESADKLADALRTRFEAVESLNELTVGQLENLAERTAALLVARQSSSPEAHKTLLTSWGGTYRVRPDDPMYDIAFNGWLPPQDPRRITAVNAAEARGTTRLLAKGHAGPSFSDPPGKGVGEVFCQYEFDPSIRSISEGESRVAEVLIPAETLGGVDIEVGFRFAWCEVKQAWLPISMLFVGPPEFGCPAAHF